MQILIEISDEEFKRISNSNPSYADDFSIMLLKMAHRFLKDMGE